MNFPRLSISLLLACSMATSAQTTRPSAGSASSKPSSDQLIYRNARFGFRYRVPFGWVDRTKEMNEPPDADDAQSAGSPSSSSSQQKAKSGSTARGEVLLAAFERPPLATGDSVNSAVVIAWESAANYPGLKKAEDYLGPLTELTTAKGFQAEGDPGFAQIDGRQVVRADFSKPLTDKLTMHQSTLVLLAKGQIVSFTFIAGSADEVEDLIGNLHFEAARTPAH